MSYFYSQILLILINIRKGFSQQNNFNVHVQVIRNSINSCCWDLGLKLFYYKLNTVCYLIIQGLQLRIET